MSEDDGFYQPQFHNGNVPIVNNQPPPMQQFYGSSGPNFGDGDIPQYIPSNNIQMPKQVAMGQSTSGFKQGQSNFTMQQQPQQQPQSYYENQPMMQQQPDFNTTRNFNNMGKQPQMLMQGSQGQNQGNLNVSKSKLGPIGTSVPNKPMGMSSSSNNMQGQFKQSSSQNNNNQQQQQMANSGPHNDQQQPKQLKVEIGKKITLEDDVYETTIDIDFTPESFSDNEAEIVITSGQLSKLFRPVVKNVDKHLSGVTKVPKNPNYGNIFIIESKLRIATNNTHGPVFVRVYSGSGKDMTPIPTFNRTMSVTGKPNYMIRLPDSSGNIISPTDNWLIVKDTMKTLGSNFFNRYAHTSIEYFENQIIEIENTSIKKVVYIRPACSVNKLIFDNRDVIMKVCPEWDGTYQERVVTNYGTLHEYPVGVVAHALVIYDTIVIPVIELCKLNANENLTFKISRDDETKLKSGNVSLSLDISFCFPETASKKTKAHVYNNANAMSNKELLFNTFLEAKESINKKN